jgi:hypothetical protein
MNLEQLKKLIGSRIQLAPRVIHLDALGRELPPRDVIWILSDVSDKEVSIDEATELTLRTSFGRDIVHHFDTNRSKSIPGGMQFGFLILTQQMYIREHKITWQPCSRPGERVPPPPAPIAELWVDFHYPVTSGIHAKLEALGYRLGWVPLSRLPGLEFEGWERVVEADPHGMPTSFYLRRRPENEVLAKKRME